MADLDEVQKAIMKAPATVDEHVGRGVITNNAGLSTPRAMPEMRSLLKGQLMERPVKGKYIISALGRNA